jgi:hypothetical protein
VAYIVNFLIDLLQSELTPYVTIGCVVSIVDLYNFIGFHIFFVTVIFGLGCLTQILICMTFSISSLLVW